MLKCLVQNKKKIDLFKPVYATVMFGFRPVETKSYSFVSLWLGWGVKFETPCTESGNMTEAEI